MYQFNPYWTEKMKIDFLQRIVLIHSYLYYELDNPVWQDRRYDIVGKQLAELQKRQKSDFVRYKTQYGYAFYDYDGTTGFLLWSRLTESDREKVKDIVKMMLGNG